MNNDSIEAILNDCTISPKVYCYQYDCGQGIYDELADYVPDMCIHLVGRTKAVMRHNMLAMVDNDEFHIGDRIMRANGRTGEVIGFAIGKDGEDGHWKTYLCPIKEARHLKVPSPAEVRLRIMQVIQAAADGSRFTTDEAEANADYILDMAHACFTNKEFPVGGAE